MTADASMVALFKAELELCKVDATQTVAVLSEGHVRADYAQAFMAAAMELGAHCFHVNLPPRVTSQGFAGNMGRTAIEGNRAAIDALKSADIVIDLMFLLFSKEQLEITDSGTRMLLVLEPIEVLSRMFPNEDLRRRVEFGADLLGRAKEMRITSPSGTDVTYRLGQYPVVTEYGYTDTPGRWDHWPSGFLFTGGADDGVDGTVVLAPGDIMCAFRQYVQRPSGSRAATSRRSRAARSMRRSCATTWPASTIPRPMPCPISAGVSIRGPTGTTWPLPIPSKGSGWTRCPSTATFCSRPARTASWAARTTRPATSTCRFAIAP